MDNIKRVLPIRKYKLQNPIVIAFNIHLTHYNAFGNRHYERLVRTLTNSEGANVSRNSVYLLPNITNMNQTIETRGHSMSKYLNQLLNRVGA